MQLEVLELLRAGQHLQAQAQAVQNLKCLAQVAINNGDWRLGWGLTTLADPQNKISYGGLEEETMAVSAFLEAQLTLQEKLNRSKGFTSQQQPTVSGTEEDGAKPPRWKKKNNWKKQEAQAEK